MQNPYFSESFLCTILPIFYFFYFLYYVTLFQKAGDEFQMGCEKEIKVFFLFLSRSK